MFSNPNVLNFEEHGIVKQRCNRALVSSNEGRVSIEALSHLEDTCCLVVLGPEVFGHFGNCVDTDAVKFVNLDDVLDPAKQIGADE